jgi:hypothetical protein
MASKENLIELTTRLYRLTLLFPKKEPLRYKLREEADDFLAFWVQLENVKNQNGGVLVSSTAKNVKNKELIFDLEDKIETIHSFLELAKWQNWVNFFQVLEVQEEYAKIRAIIKEEIKGAVFREDVKNLTLEFGPERFFTPEPALAKTQENPEVRLSDLGGRKQKIMDYLKEKGKVQVQDVKGALPKVSKRTLRRDFQYLLKEGVVEKIGDKNNTFYQIKGWDNSGTDRNFGLS